MKNIIQLLLITCAIFAMNTASASAASGDISVPPPADSSIAAPPAESAVIAAVTPAPPSSAPAPHSVIVDIDLGTKVIKPKAYTPPPLVPTPSVPNPATVPNPAVDPAPTSDPIPAKIPSAKPKKEDAGSDHMKPDPIEPPDADHIKADLGKEADDAKSDLPFTGFNLMTLAGLGSILILIGLGLRFAKK